MAYSITLTTDSSLGFSTEPPDAFKIWPAYIACHLTGPRRRRPSMCLRDHEQGERDPDTGRSTLQVLTNTRSHDGVAGFKFLNFDAATDDISLVVELDPRDEG